MKNTPITRRILVTRIDDTTAEILIVGLTGGNLAMVLESVTTAIETYTHGGMRTDSHLYRSGLRIESTIGHTDAPSGVIVKVTDGSQRSAAFYAQSALTDLDAVAWVADAVAYTGTW